MEIKDLKVMPKILLVEDNEMNRDMLERRLVRNGYEVTTAINGLDALLYVREDQPDLILMDLTLPIIDGLEATRRLKSNPSTRYIPIIILTAHALNSDRENALNAGCDDFDTKPMDFKRLLVKIEALLPEIGYLAKTLQAASYIKSLVIK